MVALPLLVLVVALVLGVPIAVALAGSGMLGIYFVTGDASKVMGILSLAPFSTVADYALTTIPMFILMAFFSASSGLARDLYAAASNWCSHIKGGLAIATVFACGVFGAMSGASTAAASVMSKIAMPEMRRHGYSDELAAGAIGIGATLDIDPAEHRHGNLRHRHPNLDRQAADRRRRAGNRRRHPARRHGLSVGRHQPQARALDLPRQRAGALDEPRAHLAEPA